MVMEYATVGIGVNTVAPGVVYTPLHRNTPKDVMESLLPKGRPSMVKDIADAVMYLTDAATVTGHILCIDCGARFAVEKRLAPRASRASVRDPALNSRRI
ncbi:MAG: SDR family oxidoreductase [Planctomycetaceae bacterium]|nr:SDR family oxidoreductase [Planctomycetaceae bacterium]